VPSLNTPEQFALIDRFLEE